MTVDSLKRTRQMAGGCFSRRLPLPWILILILPLLSCGKNGGTRLAIEHRAAAAVNIGGRQRESRSNSAARTGFVYDDVYLRHKVVQGHPEKPERLKAIVERLETSGLLAQLDRLRPRPAEEEWLLAVHTADYVRRACADCRRAGSYDATVAAAGGVLTAVDAVVAGKIRNAFCAVRPPGHHATKDHGGGYCVFNNVAIAARYAQRKHKLAKVLIVDWDVHHGNGTQAIFYDDPSVLYFSVHRDGIYPNGGSAAERGAGAGLGLNINVPLEAGSGDAEYRKASRSNCFLPPGGSSPTWCSSRPDSTPQSTIAVE